MKKIKAYITSEAYVNGEGCIAGDIREVDEETMSKLKKAGLAKEYDPETDGIEKDATTSAETIAKLEKDATTSAETIAKLEAMLKESFTLAAKKEPTGYAEYFDGKGK